MVAKNDITGDLIQSRVKSKQYDDNFDSIFQKKVEFVVRPDGVKMNKCGNRCWLEIKNDLFHCSKPNCSLDLIEDKMYD